MDTIKGLDLFKYSPYKNLTADQHRVCAHIFRERDWNKENTVIVEGLPGTGKTILAVHLFKLLKESVKTKDKEMAILIPQESLRKTIRKLFRSLDGLKAGDVIGPYDVGKKDYEILVIDEGHRLRKKRAVQYEKAHEAVSKRFGLPADADEMDWAVKKSTIQIIFYDQLQVIRPSGIEQERVNDKFRQREVSYYQLDSQMRVKGGNDYLKYVYSLLGQEAEKKRTFRKYEFKLVEEFAHFNQLMYEMEEKFGLCRMVAGYEWKWKSDGDKTGEIQDIIIDGIEKRWNGTRVDWVDSKNALNEVGCVHTVQGYDLNYAFVIVGEDLKYRDGRIIIDKKKYFDKNGKKTATEEELAVYIRNIYYVLMSRGIYGTYLHVCDEELRSYFRKYIEVYRD